MSHWTLVNMIYELEVISDILGLESKAGKRILLTKNDKIKKLFNLNEIEIEEFIDPKNGKHIKKYSTVFKGDICYKINKPYEELKYILINKTEPIVGFVRHSKNIKKYK